MALFEQLQAIQDVYQTVEAPELGEGQEIRIKKLKAKDYSRILREKDTDKSNALLIALSVVNQDGQREIPDNVVDQLLDVMPVELMSRLLEAITSLNIPAKKN